MVQIISSLGREIMFDAFLEIYEEILHVIAQATVHTLEIIGISIVIFGSIKVLYQYVKSLLNRSTTPTNAVIALGRNLALALEFKMGAEIVNTVIVRELEELLILGIVILLRAVLAVLIHWEITTEEKEERAHRAAREGAFSQETKTNNENGEQGK